MTLVLRPEQGADAADISRVNAEAFGGETEVRLVEALRRSPAFIPELSLVALRAGELVGHILFSPIAIRSDRSRVPALALAPMAVRPGFQRLGIGSALVQEGLAACVRLGHGAVIVLGHAHFYPRFGFVDAERFGIRAPFPVSPGVFMAQELVPGALRDAKGTVHYPAEFDGL